MPEPFDLRSATADEITQALSFALQFQGRKGGHHADDMMTRITAVRLAKHLEASGFLVMKRLPRTTPRIGAEGPRILP